MIVDKIKKDLVEALKSKDKVKLTLLRYLKSALKNAEIDAGKTLSEQEEIKILQSQIKQRQQALDLYKKGGRDDLAKHEQEEIDIISQYLPKQLSEEEITEEVKKAISELNAQSMKDMGKVMKYLKEKLGARADGKLLSGIVRSQLSK
jgi:uncharacterized protein YqeY